MKPPRARGAVLRGVVCGQRDALFAPRNVRVQPAQQPYLAGRLLDGSWKAPRRFPGRARAGRLGQLAHRRSTPPPPPPLSPSPSLSLSNWPSRTSMLHSAKGSTACASSTPLPATWPAAADVSPRCRRGVAVADKSPATAATPRRPRRRRGEEPRGRAAGRCSSSAASRRAPLR